MNKLLNCNKKDIKCLNVPVTNAGCNTMNQEKIVFSPLHRSIVRNTDVQTLRHGTYTVTQVKGRYRFDQRKSKPLHNRHLIAEPQKRDRAPQPSGNISTPGSFTAVTNR